MRRTLLAVAFAFAAGVAVGLLAARLLPDDEGRVRLSQRGGDVWRSAVRVGGSVEGCGVPVVEVADRPVRVDMRGETFRASVPLARGRNTVTVACGEAREQRTFLRRDTPLPAPEADPGQPNWIAGADVYGVVPRNFGETGGFRDVTARLGALDDLGIDTLWLSPSNATVEGDFGYAVTDYFRLREDYGTEADFRRLIREAHGRGIRVLMDFVPNHTSVAHGYFKSTAHHGRASRYWSFYDREADGEATNYFDWTHLPNLNYDNREVRRMMIEAFAYWVREFDVDGFRVDVAWGVRERAPDFWPELRARLDAIKPDVLLIAEASARDPYYFSHGFEAAYDWTDELGQWAWEGVFDAATPAQLVRRLDAALARSPRRRLVFRFLNNNDTGASFVSRYGTDMTRVAAALLLTLPGIPLIYTGEEVGASFSPYADTAPIVWRDRYSLRPHYKRLLELRNSLPALQGLGFARLRASAPGVYAYVRSAAAGRPVLVVLNFSGEPATVRLALPPALRGPLHDRLDGRALRRGPIAVEAYGARLLSPAGS